MSAKPPSYSNPDPHAVAIVGLSISAPGGEARGLDTEAFYEFLQRRGSGIVTVPKDRWNADAFYGSGPGKICTTRGAFIPEFAAGDPQEFGITPAEAAQLAVTQVASLHQAFNALQRSGVDYRGTNTGVFVGCAGGGPPMEMDITQAGAYYMTGSSLSITANRISYVFDLLGQSMPVDTACSSSLTAMHLAAQAIRRGECDQAVVAGVNVILTPLETASFSQLGVMSPDGISKSFDDDANGYARGDVASAVVIKRHDLAVRDNDRVYATLVGSALTSCGSIMGSLTTPSPEAQTQAIRNAYHDAGLEPFQADFVELHGAGTVVGDALEAFAAGALFSEHRDGREILMGSVKSNVGHGEMGAYMSSLIKVVMMLDRRQVLPNGYFNKPSSKIEFEKYNLRVPTSVEDFIPHDPDQGLIASISSYGFGGSCGHTVLREHERRPSHVDKESLARGPFLFAIGALTPKSVHTLIERYKEDHADTDPQVLCEHLANRARQMPWRTFVVAKSIDSASFPDPVMVGKRPYPVVLCFSGQGPQHWEQGRNLMRTYAVFRESILACDRVHELYTGKSCLAETGLFVPDAPRESILATSLSWPADAISVAITFFQIAMFDLLTSLGFRPDAVVGHSIGETAVLYASGAMPRDMVVKIAIARGRALSKVDNTGGAMIAISGCDEASVRDHIEAVSFLGTQSGLAAADLHLAAFNSPTDIGVSGPEAQVDLLRNYIETWVDGVAARKLRVSTAVHSPFVDPCEGSYRAELKTIFEQYEGAGAGPFVPKVPTMSTVTAEFRTEGYTIDYLWKNLRQPVLFSQAVENLVEKYGQYTSFLEISPHPVLSQSIKKMGALDSLPTATRPPSARQLKARARLLSEHETLLRAIGQLLLYGINSINFSVLNGCPAEYIEGPAYPFQFKEIPFALPVPSYLNRLLPRTRPLNSTRLRISPQLPEPWISHHVIDHSNLIPAATYIEMALEFPGVTQVWDCHFEAACILEESVPAVTLEVANDGIAWSVKSASTLQSIEGNLEWTRTGPVFDKTHAYGKVGYGKPQLDSSSITSVDVDAVVARCLQTNYKEEMYADMEGFAQFGDEFKRLNKACMNETEAICWIRGHVEGVNTTDYQFHPALMDAVFQTAITWNMLYDKINVGDKDRSFLLPHSLRRAYRNDGSYEPLILPEEFVTYTILQECSPRHWIIDAYVLDDAGAVLFTFEGLYFKLVDQNEQWPQQRYTMYWQPRALPQTQLEDHVIVKGPLADDVELLTLLDQLALAYSHKSLSTLPNDFDVESMDRRRYLMWARTQAERHPQPSLPQIPSSIRQEYSSLIELTERVGKNQKDILSSSAVAIELLFHDDLMNKVYEQPPFTGPVFDAFIEQFLALIKQAALSGKRVVRVLEVGSGTGRLTVLLGQALIDAKMDELCFVDYVTTDVATYLAQQSAARSPWPTVTSLGFDLNSPIDGQGLDPASFDVVIAFDVLHAIPNIQSTLDTLRNMLLPGGHLAIIELDGRCFAGSAVGTIWMDFVFGSFAEWMGVLDERPNAEHCSLAPDDWKVELERAGFSDTLLITSSTESVSHIAFISQALPGSAPLSPVSSTSSSKPLTPPQTYLDPHIRAVSPDTSSESSTSDEIGDKVLDDLCLPSIHTADSALGLPSPISTASLVEDRTIVHHFPAGGEVELVRLLSNLDSSVQYTVWLHADTEPSRCTLLGIARTIRHEFGLWKIMLVQFHPSWNPQRQHMFIRTQLMPLKWVDPEVLVDEDGRMLVPRVVPAPATPQVEDLDGRPVNFDDSRIWRAYPPSLGPQDVEVKVAYIALSPAFPDCCEFAGEVIGLGSQVSNIALLGQRVFGVAPVSNGSIVVCKYDQVAAIPSEIPEPTAAAIAGPLAFLSSVVMRALSAVNSKKPRVLLHFGQDSPAASATLLYLDVLGLDVTVTVSDPESPYLKQAERSANIRVYPSTPCDMWSFHIRKWSSKGVDVAFNFDADPDITRETIQLLSTKGTLVQVGCELPSQLRRGCHYISVDYCDVLSEDGLMQAALDKVTPSIRARLSSSLTVFPLSKFSEAYQQAHSSTRAGSAVLLDLQTIDPEMSVLRGGILRETAAFDPRASYVIIGGVGGLGANIARCLVENGAKHVVLTSRSGESAFKPGQLIREKKIIAYLRETSGVTIDILAVDCLDVDKTKAIFVHPQRRIAGVFYVAVQLNDQLFINMDRQQDWTAVSDVKVEGLKVLLQAVNPKNLDFLVLTSSMATVTGSPGQANYAAAQTEMEAMGALLPNTISVTVPPITDGGVFVRSMPTGNARNAALDKYKALGMTGLRVAQHCVDAIWSLKLSPKYSVYIPPTDWKKVIELGSPVYSFSLRHLVAKETQEARNSAATNERSIRAACAIVLSLDVKDVEENIPLANYGLDSLTSVRLSGILKQYFDISVTQLQLLSRHMTVEWLQAMQEEQRTAADEHQEANDATDELPSPDQGTEDDTDKTVVRLNTVTEGTPLFIFHGAGGGILVLRKLSEQLNFPVFGVQDTQDAPITGTLERLAEFYLSKVVEKQPSGPYRLGGFSFGTCLALVTAQMLRAAGQVVETIVMLEGAPTIYQRSKFVASTTAKILDGTLRDEIIGLIDDMASSGAIDNASDITHQFSEHFEQVQAGSSGARWVARFCKAYVAHILMGLRASEDLAQRRKLGALDDFTWPSSRTILVRADHGVGAQPAAEGSSRFLDLDILTSDIDMRELPGTHFGVLGPHSGLADVLNELMQ